MAVGPELEPLGVFELAQAWLVVGQVLVLELLVEQVALLGQLASVVAVLELVELLVLVEQAELVLELLVGPLVLVAEVELVEPAPELVAGFGQLA